MAYNKRQKQDDELMKDVASTDNSDAPMVEEAKEADAPETTLSDAAMQARIAELESLVSSMKADLPEPGTVVRFGVRMKEGTVIRDPYTSQNPTAFRKFPPGMRLGWMNPVLRDARGWKGWKPVKYDSEIGQNLDEYLFDPPAKLEGISKIDDYVRRGKTSMLCVIPEEVWLHRAIETEEASNRRLHGARYSGTQMLREDGSVVITGEGLEESERPAGGFRFRSEQSKKTHIRKGEQQVRDFLPMDDPEVSAALHN